MTASPAPKPDPTPPAKSPLAKTAPNKTVPNKTATAKGATAKSGAAAVKTTAAPKPGKPAKTGTFGLASKVMKGYDQAEVDEFFDRARLAYEAAVSSPGTGGKPSTTHVVPDKKDPATMTADEVRQAAFTLKRGGYVVGEVDAALDRLEDALAASERAQLLGAGGEDALYGQLADLAETLQGRLTRPDGERFARGIRGWERTYDIREVDELCHRLDGYFNYGEEMSVDDVRRAAFRPRRGNLGYREPIVDAFLDRVVTVMAAVD